MKSLRLRVGVELFANHWKTFLFWGILLVILGSAAILSSAMATIISVVTLGVFVFLSGFVVIFDTFSFWRGKGSAFFLHLITGLLYLIVGGMLIDSPMLGSISITLLLGVFYLVLGVFRIFSFASIRSPKWGWGFFNGVISLLIGLMILSTWPSSSLFIIGLFVGIDLLFCGWGYIMVALSARALKKG